MNRIVMNIYRQVAMLHIRLLKRQVLLFYTTEGARALDSSRKTKGH